MFRVENIEKLDQLKRKSRYESQYRDELKLVSFTLNKEIEKDEKHNFNILFDFFKSKECQYFTILSDGFHCDKEMIDFSSNFRYEWSLRVGWRSSHYTISKKGTYWDSSLFRDKSEYKGLYVKKDDNTYKHFSKRKEILNFYFSNGIATNTAQMPLPAYEFTRDTAIDIKTSLAMLSRFVTKDIIVTNLKQIRRYVKQYHWQGKEEIVAALKQYSHIK